MDDMPTRLDALASALDKGHVVTASTTVRQAACEIEELREALENMMGAFDTPISRRRISGDLAVAARLSGRAALANTHSEETM